MGARLCCRLRFCYPYLRRLYWRRVLLTEQRRGNNLAQPSPRSVRDDAVVSRFAIGPCVDEGLLPSQSTTRRQHGSLRLAYTLGIIFHDASRDDVTRGGGCSVPRPPLGYCRASASSSDEGNEIRLVG